jgi:hypothetical protein
MKVYNTDKIIQCENLLDFLRNTPITDNYKGIVTAGIGYTTDESLYFELNEKGVDVDENLSDYDCILYHFDDEYFYYVGYSTLDELFEDFMERFGVLKNAIKQYDSQVGFL